MKITIGIDIGQRVDPTSVCVTEEVWRPVPKNIEHLEGLRSHEDHHIVRHLERLPLGTPYTKVRDRLHKIIADVEHRVMAANLVNQAGWLVPEDQAIIRVYLDATGVGKPVVDMLAAVGSRVTAVYFTHGDRRKEAKDETSEEPIVVLGKAFMVARLQALLQSRRLHLPRTDEALALAQELVDYEIKIDQNANDKYGAFRVGAHDDLVTALGLSVNEIPQQAMGVASAPGVLSTASTGQPDLLTPGNDPWAMNNWGGFGAAEEHPLDRFHRPL